MKRHFLFAVSAFLTVSATADDHNLNHCLSIEQKRELDRRMGSESWRVATDVLSPSLLKQREAKRSLAAAQEALSKCEERGAGAPNDGACDSERAEVHVASKNLAAALEEIAAARAELKSKVSAAFQAIRTEYPACDRIDR